MDKDKDFFDDLYKMMDPLGFYDHDKDGHYDSEERFWVEENEREEREAFEKSQRKTTTDFGDDDDDDDLDADLDADDMDEEVDEFDTDDDDNDDEEDVEYVIPVHATVKVSPPKVEEKKKKVEEADIDTSEDNYGYSFKKSYRVAPDFIKRDREEEKRVGIDDIHFYCHWLPDFDSILIVQGEIIAKNLKGRFSLRGEIHDKDGDLIEVLDNASYTGGSGFEVRRIMPEIFFNRYPFSFELHLDDRKHIPQLSIIPQVDEDDEEEVERAENIKSIATLDVDAELAQPNADAPIMTARFKKGEKIPKSLIKYIIEEYTGIEEVKCVFFKEQNNDGEYWTNLLTYTTVFSGKVKERSLLYILLYNEEKELIEWCVEDIWDKNYKNKTSQSSFFLPLNVKIGQVIVYAGIHPSCCEDTPDVIKQLDRYFG